MKLKNCMAIHCNTGEKARALIKECYKQGFTWWGNKNTDKNIFWYDYKQDTVYFLNYGYITYSNLDYYYEIRTYDFKLYEYDNLVEEIINIGQTGSAFTLGQYNNEEE